VVSKSDTERALLAAIRGEPEARPAVSLGLQARAAARIDSADHAILAMRLDGSTWTEIATTLRLSVATVGERAAAIAVRLAATESPAVPAAR
jgi:DNA-binding NarL/FixJ family response regulator